MGMFTPYILTNTPLSANGVYHSNFTPTTSERDVYSIIAMASSNVGGTLYVEQSVDGINVIRADSLAMASYTDSNGNTNYSAMLKVAIVAPFVRVSYVNGSTAQTWFVLTEVFTKV